MVDPYRIFEVFVQHEHTPESALDIPCLCQLLVHRLQHAKGKGTSVDLVFDNNMNKEE